MCRGTRVERSMPLTPDFIGFPFLSFSHPSATTVAHFHRNFFVDITQWNKCIYITVLLQAPVGVFEESFEV